MAFMSDAEITRGVGAYYNSACTNVAGSWAPYSEYATSTAAMSCCRTCVYNRNQTVMSWMPSSELPDCPSCVSDYYTSLGYGAPGPKAFVSNVGIVNTPACPGPTATSGEWLYNSANEKCYYKSSFQYGISGGQADAESKCVAMGAELVKIDDEQENDFVIYNMLWFGFFGMCS